MTPEYLVSSEAVCDFWEAGYTVLHGAVDPDLTLALATALDAESDGRLRAQAGTAIASSRMLARVACDILGATAVRLLGEPAFGNGTAANRGAWRQELQRWPVDTEGACTLHIALAGFSRERRAYAFARGSHRSGAFRATSPLLGDGRRRRLWMRALLAIRGTPVDRVACEPGDIVVHHGWTLFSVADTMPERRSLTICYVDGNARCAPPSSVGQRRIALGGDWRTLRAGDALSETFAPLVYERRALPAEHAAAQNA